MKRKMKKLRIVTAILFSILTVTLCYPASINRPTSIASAATETGLNYTKLTLYAGNYKRVALNNPTGKTTWSSSKTSVATVTTKGTIITYKSGTATISAKGGDGKTYTCKVTVIKRKQSNVAKKLKKLRDTYVEGTPWDNSNGPYYSHYESYVGGYGCYGFACLISDKLFGYANAKTHTDFDKIKIGDNIRIGDYHSVIVVSKTSSSITVVEGNFNSSIHWDRTITRDELASEGFLVTTRY